MSRVFLISDLHLGHTNMAIKRGFESTEQHDNHIIKMWNSVVNKRDVVWILGDITMEKKSSYRLLGSLNGVKNVVLGNHDRPQDVKHLMEYVNSVSGMVKYKGFMLSHCPMHESEVDRFIANIHGHVHENTIDDDRYINVSCEAVNYTPILFTELVNNRVKSNEIRELLVMGFRYLYTRDVPVGCVLNSDNQDSYPLIKTDTLIKDNFVIMPTHINSTYSIIPPNNDAKHMERSIYGRETTLNEIIEFLKSENK